MLRRLVKAIANEYLKIANGGATPTTSSAQTAASAKISKAECQAAKAVNIKAKSCYEYWR